MSERRYSEDEVALILRKATEAGAPTAPAGDADGLQRIENTMNELEKETDEPDYPETRAV